MLGITGRSILPGWIGCAPSGAQATFALVEQQADGRAALRWVEQADWREPQRTLGRLRRRRNLHRHRSVALLPRGHYLCHTMDAPADVARADWASAVRWQLKELVDFAVEDAAVDVLEVPEGTSYRSQPQLIAVAAADGEVRPLVEQAAQAGAPWAAIDIVESALRNLSGRVAVPGRAQALLHCQAGHSTLVVTWGDELLSSRQFYVRMGQVEDLDDDDFRRAMDQIGLEVQRSLDGIERAFGQVSLARVLVAPMPFVDKLVAHLTPLLYVPVEVLDVAGVIDLSAVPTLIEDAKALNDALPAIGAALRQEA